MASVSKPRKWNVNSALVAPEWRWFWAGEPEILPFWAGAGAPVSLLGSTYSLTGTADGWQGGPYGLRYRLNGAGYLESAASGFFDGADQLTIAVIFTRRSSSSTDEGLFGTWHIATGAPLVQLIARLGSTESRLRCIFNDGTELTADGPTNSITNDERIIAVATWNSNTDGKVHLYKNGLLIASSSGSDTTSLSTGVDSFLVGSYYDHLNRRIDADFETAIASRAAWNAGQITAWSRDPFGPFRMDDDMSLFVTTGGYNFGSLASLGVGW